MKGTPRCPRSSTIGKVMSLRIKETSRRTGSVLVTISTFSGALVQWYMVWIFARHFGACGRRDVFLPGLLLDTDLHRCSSSACAPGGIHPPHARWPLRTYLFLRVIGLAAGGIAFLAAAPWRPACSNDFCRDVFRTLLRSGSGLLSAGAIQRLGIAAWLGTIGLARVWRRRRRSPLRVRWWTP